METLIINGNEKQFPDALPETLADLIEQLEVESKTIIAEVDGRIVECDNFGKTKVTNGQKIELVRFMGGG